MFYGSVTLPSSHCWADCRKEVTAEEKVKGMRTRNTEGPQTCPPHTACYCAAPISHGLTEFPLGDMGAASQCLLLHLSLKRHPLLLKQPFSWLTRMDPTESKHLQHQMPFTSCLLKNRRCECQIEKMGQAPQVPREGIQIRAIYTFFWAQQQQLVHYTHTR